MIRLRTALAAAAAVALLPLTAACGDTEQGTAERAATEKQADDAPKEPAADEEPAEDTELAVGDGFRYKDGVKVTVTKVSKLKAADFGEYDVKPEADQTGFRVSWDIANGSKKPIDLDAWGFDAQGATTGGTTEPVFAENGSRLMGGRLAPAKTGTFTSEYALPKADGLDIVFTMTRMDENMNVLAEDPHWTGSIK
ncbi:hypothetical protein [Streptomyces niveus]|uniref:hypothetical protein n=1 Tax=Streptomyces niveus TaxID=193462 RepID=UPI0003C5D19F|nr:hypothetical protein [Streptomyces niveus]EST32461.1 hypothetical protein M877_04135 [Streptomyces niveus NCIMB 11891]